MTREQRAAKSGDAREGSQLQYHRIWLRHALLPAFVASVGTIPYWLKDFTLRQSSCTAMGTHLSRNTCLYMNCIVDISTLLRSCPLFKMYCTLTYEVVAPSVSLLLTPTTLTLCVPPEFPCRFSISQCLLTQAALVW